MRQLKPDQVLSIVSPVYNEAEGVDEFVDAVLEVVRGLSEGMRLELILVNDGSTDGTRAKLDALAVRHEGVVKAIHLTRNFGLCSAASAAIQYATGDVVVIMDADTQDDPAAIRQLLDAWKEGNDIVYVIRVRRKESRVLRFLTWSFYRILRFMATLDVPLDAGSFALMDRRVVTVLAALPERNRYLPGLRCWVGFRQVGIPVERKARPYGQSRQGLRSLWNLAIMAMFSFSFMPLFLFRLMAMGALAVAGFCMLLAIGQALLGLPHGPWTFTVFLIAFFGGVNLLGISIIGEYVALVFDEVRQRPLYVVDSITGKGPRG